MREALRNLYCSPNGRLMVSCTSSLIGLDGGIFTDGSTDELSVSVICLQSLHALLGGSDCLHMRSSRHGESFVPTRCRELGAWRNSTLQLESSSRSRTVTPTYRIFVPHLVVQSSSEDHQLRASALFSSTLSQDKSRFYSLHRPRSIPDICQVHKQLSFPPQMTRRLMLSSMLQRTATSLLPPVSFHLY